MSKPSILIADDHSLVREALRDLLNELGKVVGVVSDGQALVEAAQRLEPDIIFSDISMPRLNGIEATRVLRTSVPKSRVIIVTIHQEPAYLTMAFDAGARGFLLKRHYLHAELSQAVLHVLAGDRYIGLGVSEEWPPIDGDWVPDRMSEDIEAPVAEKHARSTVAKRLWKR